MRNLNLVELTELILMSVNFNVIESDKMHGGGSIEFSSDIAINISEDKNKITLQSNVKVIGNSEKKEELFKVESKYLSSFKITNKECLEQYMNDDLANHCLSLIYTIIREDVLAILSRAGLRQINFPLHLVQ